MNKKEVVKYGCFVFVSRETRRNDDRRYRGQEYGDKELSRSARFIGAHFNRSGCKTHGTYDYVSVVLRGDGTIDIYINYTNIFIRHHPPVNVLFEG